MVNTRPDEIVSEVACGCAGRCSRVAGHVPVLGAGQGQIRAPLVAGVGTGARFLGNLVVWVCTKSWW